MPEGLDSETALRISGQERERVLNTVWPDLPQAALGRRTPRQAARDGNATLPLRAAVAVLEASLELPGNQKELGGLREMLKLEPEPGYDPATVAIDQVPLSRLHRVPVAELDDERLLDLFTQAHRFLLAQSLERSARALVDRPALLEREGPAVRFTVFSDLANLVFSRGEFRAGFDWIERGRRDEPFAHREANAVGWDLLELRLRARVQTPEEWVPHLAGLLERHRSGRETNSAILGSLVQMGLVQLVPSPDKPGEMYVDTRTLQAVLARYGPRITTATGELGVSAAKPGIWTPGSDAGRPQGGGIWTPGSERAQPAAGEPSKIIITGR
jgi:hypothetical protein